MFIDISTSLLNRHSVNLIVTHFVDEFQFIMALHISCGNPFNLDSTIPLPVPSAGVLPYTSDVTSLGGLWLDGNEQLYGSIGHCSHILQTRTAEIYGIDPLGGSLRESSGKLGHVTMASTKHAMVNAVPNWTLANSSKATFFPLIFIFFLQPFLFLKNF